MTVKSRTRTTMNVFGENLYGCGLGLRGLAELENFVLPWSKNISNFGNVSASGEKKTLPTWTLNPKALEHEDEDGLHSARTHHVVFIIIQNQRAVFTVYLDKGLPQRL